jgi:hypothetical protein
MYLFNKSNKPSNQLPENIPEPYAQLQNTFSVSRQLSPIYENPHLIPSPKNTQSNFSQSSDNLEKQTFQESFEQSTFATSKVETNTLTENNKPGTLLSSSLNDHLDISDLSDDSFTSLDSPCDDDNLRNYTCWI